jgi:hypothetical protein
MQAAMKDENIYIPHEVVGSRFKKVYHLLPLGVNI